jgi:hypothetical protein
MSAVANNDVKVDSRKKAHVESYRSNRLPQYFLPIPDPSLEDEMFTVYEDIDDFGMDELFGVSQEIQSTNPPENASASSTQVALESIEFS